MLQQTRVAAVVPYYERFLQRFQTPPRLAKAPESELLALWSGLGYYSRARNLQKAARQIVEARELSPMTYESILEARGRGHIHCRSHRQHFLRTPALVDGNVRRVLARWTNDGYARRAAGRGPPARPAAIRQRWNQAVMELGATDLLLPREPRCGECPVAADCAARRAGTQNDLPLKRA